MKPILSIIFSVILVVFVSNAIAGEYYYATDNEPLYGTWINDKYEDISPPQKIVFNPDGTGGFANKGFASKVDAEKLQRKFRYLITGKWEDDDGNQYHIQRSLDIRLSPRRLQTF